MTITETILSALAALFLAYAAPHFVEHVYTTFDAPALPAPAAGDCAEYAEYCEQQAAARRAYITERQARWND